MHTTTVHVCCYAMLGGVWAHCSALPHGWYHLGFPPVRGTHTRTANARKRGVALLRGLRGESARAGVSMALGPLYGPGPDTWP
jgi:hypothetical protein